MVPYRLRDGQNAEKAAPVPVWCATLPCENLPMIVESSSTPFASPALTARQIPSSMVSIFCVLNFFKVCPAPDSVERQFFKHQARNGHLCVGLCHIERRQSLRCACRAAGSYLRPYEALALAHVDAPPLIKRAKYHLKYTYPIRKTVHQKPAMSAHDNVTRQVQRAWIPRTGLLDLA